MKILKHAFNTENISSKAFLLIIIVPDYFNGNFLSMYTDLNNSSKRNAFAETT